MWHFINKSGLQNIYFIHAKAIPLQCRGEGNQNQRSLCNDYEVINWSTSYNPKVHGDIKSCHFWKKWAIYVFSGLCQHQPQPPNSEWRIIWFFFLSLLLLSGNAIFTTYANTSRPWRKLMPTHKLISFRTHFKFTSTICKVPTQNTSKKTIKFHSTMPNITMCFCLLFSG